MNPQAYIDQKAHREMTAQISRLEDEADRLRYFGKLTTEREQSIRDRMDLAVAQYELAIAPVAIPVMQEAVAV